MERLRGIERENGKRAETATTPEQREYVNREAVQIALIRRVRERLAAENPGMPESETYSEAMHAWLGTSPDDPNSLAARFDRLYEDMKMSGTALPNAEDVAALDLLLARLAPL